MYKEHVQISHVSYIQKPRLSGNYLGNERVRINEVFTVSSSIKYCISDSNPNTNVPPMCLISYILFNVLTSYYAQWYFIIISFFDNN